MGKLYCGTSGWNYKHWREIFYPRELPQSKWLEFYSEHFDTVEINNSFYKLPERATFESWRNQSSPVFTFSVKASRFLTHLKRLSDPEEPLDRLLTHASGLEEKLGPILYQFPPGWPFQKERLTHFLELLPKNVRHVFEFRNATWQTDEVDNLLREHGVAYCIMSSPDLPCRLITTCEFTYIRMHSGGSETEGCYSDESLAKWAEHIKEFLLKGDVYIYFNNDYKGFAVENAKTLIQLMGA